MINATCKQRKTIRFFGATIELWQVLSRAEFLGISSLKLNNARQFLIGFLSYLAFALSSIAWAQEKAEQINGSSVVISSTRDPDWKNYTAFLAGMQFYEDKKSLAPHAPLQFELIKRDGVSDTGAVVIRIAGDKTWALINVGSDGLFSLPKIKQAKEDQAELLLNRKRGQYYWRPYVRTAALAENTRRLGDLRMECGVRWAIEQDELPLLMKKVFNFSGGPCSSAQVQADFVSAKKIVSIIMLDQQRRLVLDSSRVEAQGHVYYPILHDLSWSDETILEFTYEKPVENES